MHKQDYRDRTIPAAVIVVVFFVAILVAGLIWLAASLGGHLHNGERLVVVTTALTSCRPAVRPERRCGRADGTKHGITWPVRAPCVLTGRPFPGARHGDRVRDIAESGHALLRAARARPGGPPGTARGLQKVPAQRGTHLPGCQPRRARLRLRYLGAVKDNAWLKHRADPVAVSHTVSQIAHDQACRARARRARRVSGLIQLQELPWPLTIRMHSAADADYSWRSPVACAAPEGAAVYSFDLAKRA